MFLRGAGSLDFSWCQDDACLPWLLMCSHACPSDDPEGVVVLVCRGLLSPPTEGVFSAMPDTPDDPGTPVQEAKDEPQPAATPVPFPTPYPSHHPYP